MIELDGPDFQSPSFPFSQEFLEKKNAAEVRGLGVGRRSPQIQFQSSPYACDIQQQETCLWRRNRPSRESAGKKKKKKNTPNEMAFPSLKLT